MRSEMISSTRLLRLKLFTGNDSRNEPSPSTLIFGPNCRSFMASFYVPELTEVTDDSSMKKTLFSRNFLTPSRASIESLERTVGDFRWTMDDFRLVKKKNPPYEKSPAKITGPCLKQLFQKGAVYFLRFRTISIPRPKIASVAGSGVNSESGAVPSPNANSSAISVSLNPVRPVNVKVALSLTRASGFTSGCVVISPV